MGGGDCILVGGEDKYLVGGEDKYLVGESLLEGIFLGGGHEQIFGWWGNSHPILHSRENAYSCSWRYIGEKTLKH